MIAMRHHDQPFRDRSIGEPVELTYHSETAEQPTILLERAHEPGVVTPRMRFTAPAASGTMRLPDVELSAGHYEIALLDPAGFTASSNEFWILPPDPRMTLTISGDRFTVGEPLPFEWSGAPGNRHDWIGIFPAPNEDTHQSASQNEQNEDTHQAARQNERPNEDSHQSGRQNEDTHQPPIRPNGDTHQSVNDDYLTYGYVGARSSGSMLLDADTVAVEWPLPPGSEERLPLYELYHLLNHLNLFGRSYRGRCVEILRRYA